MNAPPSAFTLQRVISLAMSTIEALRTDHGMVIETDAEILDALSFEGVDAEEVLRRLVRAALDAKANAAAAESRMDDLKARRDRYRNHEAAYRDTILNVMEALGLRKWSDIEATLSVSPGKPKVIVTDERKLPDTTVRITVVRTPDKAAILSAMADRQALIDAMISIGEEPPGPFEGAILSQAPPVLTVRTK